MPNVIEYELGSRSQLLYFSLWLFFLGIIVGLFICMHSLVLKWIAFLSPRKRRASSKLRPHLLRIETPTKFMRSPGDDITDVETVGTVATPHSALG
jgi:hypothetical protein